MATRTKTQQRSPSPPTPPMSAVKKRSNGFESARKYLLYQVARGTPFIAGLQKYRSTWLDYYFIISSFLGDQFLYTYLLPWFFWVHDPAFARKFLFLLIFGTSFGNLLKNLFALPRPPSPPLWQHKRMDDFGLPSTHSLNAVTMPWFLLYYLWDKVGADSTRALMLMGFAMYSISMFFSRTYLAAHSPADVISGIICGIPILFLWINVSAGFDEFITNHELAPLVAIVVSFLFILLHPRASRPSPSYKYSVALTGLGLGTVVGAWGLRHWGPDSFALQYFSECSVSVKQYIIENVNPQFQNLAIAASSVHIGLLVMLSLYVAVKLSVFMLLGVLFDMAGISKLVKFVGASMTKLALPHPVALDNLDYPMFELRDKTYKETPKKDAKMVSEFAGAFSVGWCITYLVPPLLNCLEIGTDLYA